MGIGTGVGIGIGRLIPNLVWDGIGLGGAGLWLGSGMRVCALARRVSGYAPIPIVYASPFLLFIFFV